MGFRDSEREKIRVRISRFESQIRDLNLNIVSELSSNNDFEQKKKNISYIKKKIKTLENNISTLELQMMFIDSADCGCCRFLDKEICNGYYLCRKFRGQRIHSLEEGSTCLFFENGSSLIDYNKKNEPMISWSDFIKNEYSEEEEID